LKPKKKKKLLVNNLTNL